MMNKLAGAGVCLLLIGLLGACSGTPPSADPVSADIAALPEVVPLGEPPSRSGNPESYTVFGKAYRVLGTSAGFRERGQASWYGREFHGRRTSSGVPFNMYAISAAHKSLPIPTYVRVTRLDTGRSLVVKVNDRGPFKDGRVIDLSYAAAVKLGMAEQGTAPVEVVALEPFQYLPDHPGYDSARRLTAALGREDASPPIVPRRLTAAPTQAPIAVKQPRMALAAATLNYEPAFAALPPSTPVLNKPKVVPPVAYLQLGAFSDKRYAEDLQNRLLPDLRQAIWVDSSNQMHKVRIGPLYDEDTITRLTLHLADLGIQAHRVVE